MATAVQAEAVQRVGSAEFRKQLIDAVDAVDREQPRDATIAELEWCGLLLRIYANTAAIIELHFSKFLAPAQQETIRALIATNADMLASMSSGSNGAPAEPPSWIPQDLQDWVRIFTAVAAEFAIERFESRALAAGQPRLAHVVRTAHDSLRSFVRRNDPARAKAWATAGWLYRSGAVTLEQVADLVGLSPSDTVFELEQDGYVRPPAVIALSDEERAEIFAQLRARRLARSGPRIPDQDLVERAAIASERIEGVDARAWIRNR